MNNGSLEENINQINDQEIARAIIPEKIYYQTNTTNKSFLRMYKFLRDKGVKNNKFFLRLYDKDLMNLKPLEMINPDKYIRTKILKEIAINPWYFFREICRIKVPGGYTRYELSRGNLALNYCCLNNINTIFLLPRQCGKTVGAVVLLDWVFRYGTKNSEMIFSNKKESDATLNLKRLVEFVDEYIPLWLKPPVDPKDKYNTLYFYNQERQNSISILPKANSRENAEKLGRGMTVPIAFFDEFAFVDFNKVFYDSATFAIGKAREEALKRDKISFKLITTTPNNIDIPEGQFCRSMIDNALEFDENIIYDLPVSELMQYVRENSSNDFIFVEFKWRALGKSEEWYETQKRNSNNDKLVIKREVDLEWPLSSDKSPFNEEDLEEVEKGLAREEEIIKYRLGKRGYRLDLFEPLDPNRLVTISADCSGGLGRDSSAIHVLDNFTGKPLANFSSNRVDVHLFGDIILEVEKLFPNCCIVIERNSYGLTIVQRFMKIPEIKRKLFYEIKTGTGEEVVNNSSIITVSKSQHKVYGVDTSPKSREVMMDGLFALVSSTPENVRSPRVAKELKTLERKSSGKIEHAEGEHDDNIFSLLIGRYAQSREEFKFFKNKLFYNRNKLLKEDIDTDTKKTLKIRKYYSVETIRSGDELAPKSRLSNIFNLNN